MPRHDTGSYDEIMRLTSSPRGDGAASYDFRKSEKFSGDQTKFLERVFIAFSEAVITNLAPMLKSKFNLELLSIVPRSYHSYLNSLPETTPMMIFRLEYFGCFFLLQCLRLMRSKVWLQKKAVLPLLILKEV